MILLNNYNKNDLSYKDIIENSKNYKINYTVFEDTDDGESWYKINVYYFHLFNICIILYYDIDSSDDGDGKPTELERYYIYNNCDFKNKELNLIQDEINSMYDDLGYFDVELYTFDSINKLNEFSNETKYVYNIIQNISLFNILKEEIYDKIISLNENNNNILTVDNISYDNLLSVKNNNQILFSEKYYSIHILKYYDKEIFYNTSINFYDNLINVDINDMLFLNEHKNEFNHKNYYIRQLNDGIINNILDISKNLLYEKNLSETS